MDSCKHAWLAWLLLCLTLPVKAETVRITNGEWAPYLSSSLPHFGLVSRIVSEAFAEEGVDVVYAFFPWKRALEMARNGDWDGTVAWRRTEARLRDFYISDPVISGNYSLFHRKDTVFDWQAIKDLAPFRIGATQDYYYGSEFEEAERRKLIRVERIRSDDLIMNMLIINRVDLFPMDSVVGMNLLYQQYPADTRKLITFHPKPLQHFTLHLLLSRKIPANAQRMDRFNQGLHTLQESGAIDSYTRLMLSPPYQAPLPP